MEAVYQSLIDRTLNQFARHQQQGKGRLLIAMAGPPGSGKTTVAQRVAEILNGLPSGPSTVAISVDGYHLPLAALHALPNAAEALARRGAPWTFDGAAAAQLVIQLREAAGKRPVSVPTFDHAVKDPVAGGLVVEPDTQVCILEGNYLLTDEAPWDQVAPSVDDRWLVKVDPVLARSRVAKRHLQAGIETTMEAALKRTDENDLVNGEYVVKHSEGRYDVLVESIEEPGQKSR